MKIEKINNIDYIFIENKKYKTNTINVFFKEKPNKVDIIKRQILPKLLLDKTKNYPTTLDLSRKFSSLYSSNVSIKEQSYGDYSLLMFSITYIQSKYLNEDITNEIITLLKEIIYNPYLIDNKFDEQKIIRVQNELRNAVKQKENAFQVKAKEQALELLYKDQSCTDHFITNEIIDRIDSKEVYDYYLSVLNNNEMLIIFEGDKDIKDSLSEFKSNVVNKYEYKNPELKCDDLGLVVNKAKTKQNNLFFVYDNFDKDDTSNVKNFFFAMMLGEGASSLLFQEVREKHSLAYSIGSTFDANYKIMYIYGGVKLDSLDKTIEIINKQLDRLKSEDLTELLNDTRQSYLNNLYSSLDLKGFLTLRAIKGWLNNEFSTIEHLIDRINSVTIEDIHEIANNIQNKIMYVLQGDLNNESN